MLTLCWGSEAVAEPRPHKEPQEGAPLSVWAAVMESAPTVEHLGCFFNFLPFQIRLSWRYLIDYPYATCLKVELLGQWVCVFLKHLVCSLELSSRKAMVGL